MNVSLAEHAARIFFGRLGDATRARAPRLVFAFILCASLVGCRERPAARKLPPPKSDPPASARDAAAIVAGIVASEELILSLTPDLKLLGRGVRNLELPDDGARSLFLDEVVASDIGAPMKDTTKIQIGGLEVIKRPWSMADERKLSQAELSMWRKLLDDALYFEHARFYIERGDFQDRSRREFLADVRFEGLLRHRDGTLSGVKARQDVLWRNTGSRAAPVWRISTWRQRELSTISTPRLFYEDVLESAIPDPETRLRAQDSVHQQLLRKYFAGESVPLPPGYHDSRFFPDASNEHPGLSVVDIDADGWDDLYLTDRWGKNQLWRQLGDSTFEEVAAKYGLDIEGRSCCSVFGDFDNDGDQDVFIGRSLERSLYLRNEGGRYVDVSESHVSAPMPYLVTSASAADYNGDGLLDVYLATYSPSNMGERFVEGRLKARDWVHDYMSPEHAREFPEHARESHRWLADAGPPNFLLENTGDGRFRVAAESPQIAAWRNTLQATWCDFDGDHDPDLYLANDFAPDNLYRNDGPAGFRDVTAEQNCTGLGFSMGAGWGDYDNDGWFDLYVSNMFSKAGRRTTVQVPGLDPRFGWMAEGNFLYRNLGERFERVSGLAPPALEVARADWAWGGQFVDFDGDGFQDIYVSSGFYTPPPEVASDIDL